MRIWNSLFYCEADNGLENHSSGDVGGRDYKKIWVHSDSLVVVELLKENSKNNGGNKALVQQCKNWIHLEEWEVLPLILKGSSTFSILQTPELRLQTTSSYQETMIKVS